VFERIQFPEPVISMFIEPQTKADQDKLSTALGRLQDEDPTFRVRYNQETGQTLIEGMGELHLEVLVDRMRREFNVDALTGKPQVAYKETMTQPVEEIVSKHIKQTGGRGQYGHVVFKMEPAPSKSGVTFVNKVVGGRIPKEFIPAVEDGVMEAATSGPFAGYPVTDVVVTLYDGSFHDVDSSEIAFKIAGIEGFKQGIMKGRPVLLEPIMLAEVVMPETCLGEIIGDTLPRKASLPVVLAFAFALGVVGAFGEPVIGSLQIAGAGVDPVKAPILHALLVGRPLVLALTIALAVGVAVLLRRLRSRCFSSFASRSLASRRAHLRDETGTIRAACTAAPRLTRSYTGEERYAPAPSSLSSPTRYTSSPDLNILAIQG
jgi:hypothetical protein